MSCRASKKKSQAAPADPVPGQPLVLPDDKEQYQAGSPSGKSSAEAHRQHFPSSCRQPRSNNTRRARPHSDQSQEHPSKAPRLSTSQPPDQSKERPAKAAPISASKPPPPRRPPQAARQAEAAADKLTRLQSKQAYLRKDRDRLQLQATIVGARIPITLSDILALELSLDKHCAVRDHQDQRLRALPAELASLYLQLRLPFGQQEYLTSIQAPPRWEHCQCRANISKKQPSVRHNPVLPGHIYIRAPLKVLKQSSFLMLTRIISEASNTGQQTT